MEIPIITLTNSDDLVEEGGQNDCVLFSASSSNSSLPNSGDEEIRESDNHYQTECEVFMKSHVSQLFDPANEISSNSKQTFGEFCQTSVGRQAFAKYVDNYRCHSLEVSETTFYNLAQSFALVLFECHEADDFLPAKTLMNMSFTYYHYPVGSSLYYKQSINQPFELKSPAMKEFANHLSESEEDDDTDLFPIRFRKRTNTNGAHSVCSSKNSFDSPTEPDKSVWKSANNWLTKEISIYKQFFKDFPGKTKQAENKDRTANGTKERAHTSNESFQQIENVSKINNIVESAKEKACTNNGYLSNDTIVQTETSASSNNHKAEKIYIYQALRYQPIWRSLRFWNAAFFDAVNTETQFPCSKLQWNSLTPEEKENAAEVFRNLTFAHLGSFIINMKHLGIGNKTCLEFLRKQSVIGNLSKDLYQLLRTQIEKPLSSLQC